MIFMDRMLWNTEKIVVFFALKVYLFKYLFHVIFLLRKNTVLNLLLEETLVNRQSECCKNISKETSLMAFI